MNLMSMTIDKSYKFKGAVYRVIKRDDEMILQHKFGNIGKWEDCTGTYAPNIDSFEEVKRKVEIGEDMFARMGEIIASPYANDRIRMVQELRKELFGE